MVTITRIHSVYGTGNKQLIQSLNRLLSTIPDSIFYDNGKLLANGCKAFNHKMIPLLAREFHGSARGGCMDKLHGFYSYPVEILTIILNANDGSEYWCLFVPDYDHGMLLPDDLTPYDYQVGSVLPLFKHLADIEKVKECFVIGYYYPMCQERYGTEIA